MVVPCLQEMFDNCAIDKQKKKSVIAGFSVVYVMEARTCMFDHYLYEEYVPFADSAISRRLKQMQQSLNFLLRNSIDSENAETIRLINKQVPYLQSALHLQLHQYNQT
jgi:hypothetical protein